MLVSLVIIFCIASVHCDPLVNSSQIFEKSNAGASNEPELPSRGCKAAPLFVESCAFVKVCGVYTMLIGGTLREVYCEVIGNLRFIVVQRRGDFGDRADFFYRGWLDYQFGFGDLRKQFWLGNEALHSLTQTPQDLYIDLEDFEGRKITVIAYDVQVSHADEFFQLSMSSVYPEKYLGMTFSKLNGSYFFTKDIDFTINKCVSKIFKGGWWYRIDCSTWSNLNGMYLRGKHNTKGQGVNYHHFRGDDYSLKNTAMKFMVK